MQYGKKALRNSIKKNSFAKVFTLIHTRENLNFSHLIYTENLFVENYFPFLSVITYRIKIAYAKNTQTYTLQLTRFIHGLYKE